METCINRRVPCRNAHLGCMVSLKLSERHFHEIVDEKKSIRNCLFINGGSSHVFLDEDDISPPWTMEYWLYKSNIQKSALSNIIHILSLVKQYNISYSAEIIIKNKVSYIVNFLKGDTSQINKHDKVDMLNELTNLVSVYNFDVRHFFRHSC